MQYGRRGPNGLHLQNPRRLHPGQGVS